MSFSGPIDTGALQKFGLTMGGGQFLGRSKWFMIRRKYGYCHMERAGRNVCGICSSGSWVVKTLHTILVVNTGAFQLQPEMSVTCSPSMTVQCQVRGPTLAKNWNSWEVWAWLAFDETASLTANSLPLPPFPSLPFLPMSVGVKKKNCLITFRMLPGNPIPWINRWIL